MSLSVGGLCEDLISSYRCICSLGFMGRHCEETASPCQPNLCPGNLTCLEESEGRDDDMRSGVRFVCQAQPPSTPTTSPTFPRLATSHPPVLSLTPASVDARVSSFSWLSRRPKQQATTAPSPTSSSTTVSGPQPLQTASSSAPVQDASVRMGSRDSRFADSVLITIGLPLLVFFALAGLVCFSLALSMAFGCCIWRRQQQRLRVRLLRRQLAREFIGQRQSRVDGRNGRPKKPANLLTAFPDDAPPASGGTAGRGWPETGQARPARSRPEYAGYSTIADDAVYSAQPDTRADVAKTTMTTTMTTTTTTSREDSGSEESSAGLE
ncbi:unnamed protein product, partial [Protopolystoma xenopodis]